MDYTHRNPFAWRLVVTCACIAVVMGYASVAASLAREGWTDPLYSFGFAVPLISIYIGFARWPRCASHPRDPDYRFGWIVVAIAALALAIGEVGPAQRL